MILYNLIIFDLEIDRWSIDGINVEYLGNLSSRVYKYVCIMRKAEFNIPISIHTSMARRINVLLIYRQGPSLVSNKLSNHNAPKRILDTTHGSPSDPSLKIAIVPCPCPQNHLSPRAETTTDSFISTLLYLAMLYDPYSPTASPSFILISIHSFYLLFLSLISLHSFC